MDENSKEPNLYETLGEIMGKRPDSGIPASVIDQGKIPNSAIPASVLADVKKAKSAATTANARMENPSPQLERIEDVWVWDDDCPAIEVCEQVHNVRSCCRKGEPLPPTATICVQGVLLLIAKIHGLIPTSDATQGD